MFLRPVLMIYAVAAATLALSVLMAAQARDRRDSAQVTANEPHLPEAPTIGAVRRGMNGQLEIFGPTKQQGTEERRCSVGTICVGSGQAYPNLASALPVTREGDVVEIVAATYHETAKIAAKKVTLRSVGGRAHFDCAGLRISDDKACLLLAADGITLDNLEISGAEISEAL